jgi:hypothetical protein
MKGPSDKLRKIFEEESRQLGYEKPPFDLDEMFENLHKVARERARKAMDELKKEESER